ncbi:MAG: UDP-N-acetylglucosamine 2-epimerase (non-hydrolyzing) [Coriobacteriia bacterium]|nr:UDP-N-acetylglucosamine 2-epimerase (non-hydrolyzing) [Coriobacteriia bacterium]
MCPLVLELQKRDFLDMRICVSGQHAHMLQQVLDIFQVVPDYNLQIMTEKQTLFDITTRALNSLRSVLLEYAPDIVLVHGDTTTAFAAALAAFYLKIDVGHVEAGLRTHNIYSPFPEEYNRQVISVVTKYFFAPTQAAARNLLEEGRRAENIFVTGNTGIDALRYTIRDDYHDELLDWAQGSRLLTITAHRRENIGEPLYHMLRGIRRIFDYYPDVKAIYPVHLNPQIRQVAADVFGDCDKIRLVEPLDVVEFHNVMARSYLILTDSGGIQEEAPSLGKPVLVMRDTSERPEGIAAGTLRLVGTSTEAIYQSCAALLDDPEEYRRMSVAINPYGDGYAAAHIADALVKLTAPS